LQRLLEPSPVVQRSASRRHPSDTHHDHADAGARAGLREAVISERRLPADSWPLGCAGDVLTLDAGRGRPFAARRNRHAAGALDHGIALRASPCTCSA